VIPEQRLLNHSCACTNTSALSEPSSMPCLAILFQFDVRYWIAAPLFCVLFCVVLRQLFGRCAKPGRSILRSMASIPF
jgi:hypothetical protein